VAVAERSQPIQPQPFSHIEQCCNILAQIETKVKLDKEEIITQSSNNTFVIDIQSW
jgi:hypothetical protein